MRQVDGDTSLTELVERARNRDQDAWNELVARMAGVIWRTTMSMGLRRADAEDVYSSTIFRLLERLDSIREPERIAGWLATTAHNEAVTLLRRSSRAVPTEDVGVDVAETGEPDTDLLDSELRRALHAGFTMLGEECRRLLRLLTLDPPLSYEEIALVLGRPLGAIGPTRGRCLQALRATSALRSYVAGSPR